MTEGETQTKNCYANDRYKRSMQLVGERESGATVGLRGKDRNRGGDRKRGREGERGERVGERKGEGRDTLCI